MHWAHNLDIIKKFPIYYHSIILNTTSAVHGCRTVRNGCQDFQDILVTQKVINFSLSTFLSFNLSFSKEKGFLFSSTSLSFFFFQTSSLSTVLFSLMFNTFFQILKAIQPNIFQLYFHFHLGYSTNLFLS